MAAPVAAQKYSFTGRDAKGNTARVSVLIGDATAAATQTDAGTLRGHLNAMGNANWTTNIDATKPVVYGSSAQFQNIEDKLVLVFKDPSGFLHRYQIGAPSSSVFLPDLETPLASAASLAAIITDFQTFVYGRSTDTAPLVYVGGIRIRRKLHRRFNILTLNPSLTGPGE